MNSPLAAVVAQRGRMPLAPRGLLVHVTGSGIVEQARRSRADPEEFAVSAYAGRLPYYPHYLVARDGDLYAFCDEDRRAAHAAWRPWEVRLYAKGGGDDERWTRRWARDFLDGVVEVGPLFYDRWFERWGAGRGLNYRTPCDLLIQLGAPASTPNSCYVGVECLSSDDPREPLADAQVGVLAALFVDLARRRNWFDPATINPAALPQAWLCSHSDVSPGRRYQRTRSDRQRGTLALPHEGFPFDPPAGAIDWADLGGRIIAAAAAH